MLQFIFLPFRPPNWWTYHMHSIKLSLSTLSIKRTTLLLLPFFEKKNSILSNWHTSSCTHTHTMEIHLEMKNGRESNMNTGTISGKRVCHQGKKKGFTYQDAKSHLNQEQCRRPKKNSNNNNFISTMATLKTNTDSQQQQQQRRQLKWELKSPW